MTKTNKPLGPVDERDRIMSADFEDARLRKHCAEASARYLAALVEAGHLQPERKAAA